MPSHWARPLGSSPKWLNLGRREVPSYDLVANYDLTCWIWLVSIIQALWAPWLCTQIPWAQWFHIGIGSCLWSIDFWARRCIIVLFSACRSSFCQQNVYDNRHTCVHRELYIKGWRKKRKRKRKRKIKKKRKRKRKRKREKEKQKEEEKEKEKEKYKEEEKEK